MKKIILFVFMIFTLMLSSCRIKNNNTNNKVDGITPTGDETFWNSFASVNIVSDEDENWLYDFSKKAEKSIGISVNLRKDLVSDKDCQIINDPKCTKKLAFLCIFLYN